MTVYRIVPILLAIFLIADRPASAQTADQLFAANVVHEIRLFMHSGDLWRLQHRYRENTYYPADFVWEGIPTRNVAVRSRGNGSRSEGKPSLRLDFGRYVSGQRVGALSSLVLDNLLLDPSMLREYTAMAFLARMGMPTPRLSFARVYINEVFFGLYLLQEEYDQDYLAHAFRDPNGYLFEYRWARTYYLEDLGDGLDRYAPLFEPRTHRTAAMSTLYSPLREMMRAPHDEADLDGWRRHVEQYLDLQQFVRLTALEAYMSEHDGVTGYAGANNFYLFRPAGSSQHSLIPWDRDHSFHHVESSILQRADENQLLRRALAFADLQTAYRDTLIAAAAAASDEAWLETFIATHAALIAPYAVKEPSRAEPAAEWQQGVAELLDFARRREAHVLEQIARARESGAPRH